ncbi:MAG: OmpA family protein [Ignavibacteriae bacterium]|nr:MAG: OmpA family protein [Ignavibacteriota bacterium]
MIKNGMVVLTIVLCMSIILMGCGTSKTLQGGAIGAGAGALVGAVIGKIAGNTAAGAIVGAAVGGTAGALIGHNMDKQAAEMKKDLSGAKVERVGEGIKITFASGILFKTGSAELQAPAKENIASLAKILAKYEDTNILIEGDTDSEGGSEMNQKLSERRAQAVADYTKSLGISQTRISTIGRGETNPVASNETVEGRAQNRRVEVAIFANEKMKNAAENGTLE